MQFTQNHYIFAGVLLILFLILNKKNEKTENFTSLEEWPALPPKHWKQREITEWEPKYFYKNETAHHPAVPSITRYDPRDYQLPERSMDLLNKLNTNGEGCQNGQCVYKMPQNMDMVESSEDELSQVGAPVDELNRDPFQMQEMPQPMPEQVVQELGNGEQEEIAIPQEPESSIQQIKVETVGNVVHKFESGVNMQVVALILGLLILFRYICRN